MTMALAAISLYRDTKAIDTSHRNIMSNHALNVFYEGLLDKDGVLDDEGDYTDGDGAVDDEER